MITFAFPTHQSSTECTPSVDGISVVPDGAGKPSSAAKVNPAGRVSHMCKYIPTPLGLTTVSRYASGPPGIGAAGVWDFSRVPAAAPDVATTCGESGPFTPKLS